MFVMFLSRKTCNLFFCRSTLSKHRNMGPERILKCKLEFLDSVFKMMNWMLLMIMGLVNAPLSLHAWFCWGYSHKSSAVILYCVLKTVFKSGLTTWERETDPDWPCAVHLSAYSWLLLSNLLIDSTLMSRCFQQSCSKSLSMQFLDAGLWLLFLSA